MRMCSNLFGFNTSKPALSSHPCPVTPEVQYIFGFLTLWLPVGFALQETPAEVWKEENRIYGISTPTKASTAFKVPSPLKYLGNQSFPSPLQA